MKKTTKTKGRKTKKQNALIQKAIDKIIKGKIAKAIQDGKRIKNENVIKKLFSVMEIIKNKIDIQNKNIVKFSLTKIKSTTNLPTNDIIDVLNRLNSLYFEEEKIMNLEKIRLRNLELYSNESKEIIKAIAKRQNKTLEIDGKFLLSDSYEPNTKDEIICKINKEPFNKLCEYYKGEYIFQEPSLIDLRCKTNKHRLAEVIMNSGIIIIRCTKCKEINRFTVQNGKIAKHNIVISRD